MTRQVISQWLRCYKSYWFNLVAFIISIIAATLGINESIESLMDSAIGFFIVDIAIVCAILLIAMTQFKEYKEKDRYITFLHVKNLLNKESNPQ